MPDTINILYARDKIQKTKDYIFEQHSLLQISDKTAKELLEMLEKINTDLVNSLL